MTGESICQQPNGASTTEGLARAASTPPAAANVLAGSSDAETSPLGLLKMEARKTTEDIPLNSVPLEGDFIAPYVDLANCTRVELEWDSIAAQAILRLGVEDFTVRNFEAQSWEVKPKKRKDDDSDSEDEDSTSEEQEDEDDKLHTRLSLGMGIHETEFKGEKVFLELRFTKDAEKTFMNNRCGELIHNRTMTIFVAGVGRGKFVQEFLEQIIRRIPVADPPKKRPEEFEIYRWCHCRETWRHTQTQKGRDMKSVILPEGMIEKIQNDMEEFLSPETAIWYERFGIPYKRSYLFHGVPGSGKTSLITALAAKLKRNVCFLSAHNPSFSDDIMKQAMERLPRRAFLIMEDIDSLFNQRRSMNSRSPLTFTGLLNCLDGIGHATGQIVIMTTNYIDRLDDALIRAGRADMWIEFKCATPWQLGEIFKWFYHRTPEDAEKWKDTFVTNCTAKYPEGVTIAEMQQHFVDCRKKTAQECAETVKDYDMPARKFTIGEKAKAKKEFLKGKEEPREESPNENGDARDEEENDRRDDRRSSESDERDDRRRRKRRRRRRRSDRDDRRRSGRDDRDDRRRSERDEDRRSEKDDRDDRSRSGRDDDRPEEVSDPHPVHDKDRNADAEYPRNERGRYDADANYAAPAIDANYAAPAIDANYAAPAKDDKSKEGTESSADGKEFSLGVRLHGGVVTVTMAALFAMLATVMLAGLQKPML